MASKTLSDGQWTHDWIKGAFDDPAIAIITCCLPCVQYGQLAQKVHGGDCLQHGGMFCVSGCCCLSGLFAGPTRKTIRDYYKLPQQPTGLGSEDPTNFFNTDCVLHTIPCTGCFVMCQEANEIKDRNPTTTLGAGFDPFKKDTQTAAPKQETMEKPTEKPVVDPNAPAVTVAVPEPAAV